MRINFNNLNANNVNDVYSYLSQFVGKEYWIKVAIEDTWNKYYIKVLSLDDVNVVANKIEAHFVDDPVDHIVLQIDIDDLSNEYTFDLYDVYLVPKSDVISTAELLEILNENLIN